MLQEMNAAIYEGYNSGTVTDGGYVPTTNTGYLQCGDPWPYQTIYWNSYPVYVCTDKTKKAIEVLKALQADKLLDCKSVPRFIELVEKIANIL